MISQLLTSVKLQFFHHPVNFHQSNLYLLFCYFTFKLLFFIHQLSQFFSTSFSNCNFKLSQFILCGRCSFCILFSSFHKFCMVFPFKSLIQPSSVRQTASAFSPSAIATSTSWSPLAPYSFLFSVPIFHIFPCLESASTLYPIRRCGIPNLQDWYRHHG